MAGAGSRCETCAPIYLRRKFNSQTKPSSSKRGYNYRWRKFSEHCRRIQPWCTDCGATEDLTTDHSTEAWVAFNTGKRITADMVTVLCRPCNSKRGRARPIQTGGDQPRTARVSTPGSGQVLDTHRRVRRGIA